MLMMPLDHPTGFALDVLVAVIRVVGYSYRMECDDEKYILIWTLHRLLYLLKLLALSRRLGPLFRTWPY